MKLTRDEIVLVASILGALVLGATVRYYRDLHRMAAETMAPTRAARVENPPIKKLPANDQRP